MSPFELRAALESMVCLVDSREQNTPYLRARLARMNCPYEREKLDFGDYSAKFQLPDESWLDLRDKVAVERKMSLDELCNCFCNDRKRFSKEFERAKAAGAKIYMLIENGSFEGAYNGKYRSQMTPQALVASMLTWLARYNCQIIMCSPKISGMLIRDILYREGKELLGNIRGDNKWQQDG